MPITFFSPDIRTQEGGVSQFMLADNSVGSAEIQAGAVGLSELLSADQGRFLARSSSGNGQLELVTPAQAAAILQDQSFSFSVRQRFAAQFGLTLVPGSDPVSPEQGQMWFDSTRNCPMYFDGTAARPVNEVGTWTPTLTFATPGDLSVAYTTQTGRYRKYGRLLYVEFRIVTSTFTFTTATGAFNVAGLPFTMQAANEPLGTLLMHNYAGIIAGTGNSAMYLQGVANASYLLLRRQTPAATTAGSLQTTYQVSSFASGTNVTVTGVAWLGLVNES